LDKYERKRNLWRNFKKSEDAQETRVKRERSRCTEHVFTKHATFLGQTACGGLIRNHHGHFMKGFSCNLGAENALIAELWDILFSC
jgi:hypothetical protein